jgi:hypothetical protein
MKGRRRPDNTLPWELEAGDYCFRGPSRFLWVCLPNGSGPARLEEWDVTEHQDGTVTVSPSILEKLADNKDGWHGYLERGIWREVG